MVWTQGILICFEISGKALQSKQNICCKPQVNVMDLLFCLSQGMIKVALYIKKKLEGGILEKAFNSDPVRNFIDS